jgi:hypothetical protein
VRRLFATLTTTALLAAAGAALTGLPGAGADPRPVPPQVRTVALSAPSADTGRMSATDRATAATEARGAASEIGVLVASDEVVAPPDRPLVVGMTWRGGADTSVAVQYRTRTGTAAPWSAWTTVTGGDHEHGPDGGSAEATGARDGSEPIAVGAGTRVQLRTLGQDGDEPREPKAVVVDPGASPADVSVGARPAGAAGASASRPVIYTRAQWGADERLRADLPEYAGVQAAAIHHTVNSNTYSSSQVPALIRGMYAYHVQGRGWNDLGYNFVIDRFGRTWEGRYGGVDRAVVGAQARGSNSWTFGAAALGDYTSTAVPGAVTAAYQRLVAWKAQVHQFDPARPANVGGRIERGVSGHRDLSSTSCPGNVLYGRIPSIAAGASAGVRGLASLSVNRDIDNRGDNDALVTNAAGDLMLYHADRGALAGPEYLSRGVWKGVDLVASPGDWNGDLVPDVMARVVATGRLRLYPGDGDGSLRSGVDIGSGWQAMTRVTGTGDLTGDGHPDVVAVDGSGRLLLYPGSGRGGFLRPSAIGSGWSGIRLVVGVGDWDGNGTRDILGVTTTGTAIVYRGTGRGRLSGSVVLEGSWAGWQSVAALGDATNDTRVDVLAQGPYGEVAILASTADPAVVREYPHGSSWDAAEVYPG